MAALTADYNSFRLVPGSGLITLEIGMNSALTFFRGALAHITSGTGKAIRANADGDEFFGVVEKGLVGTAADQLITCIARGIVWFSGVAQLTTGNAGKLVAATAASDNPVDIVAQGAGTPGAMGRLLIADVTAVSGYIDLSDRSAVANA